MGNRSGIRAAWSRWTWWEITWWFVWRQWLPVLLSLHLTGHSSPLCWIGFRSSPPQTLSNSRWHKPMGEWSRKDKFLSAGILRQSSQLRAVCGYHCDPVRGWPRRTSLSLCLPVLKLQAPEHSTSLARLTLKQNKLPFWDTNVCKHLLFHNLWKNPLFFQGQSSFPIVKWILRFFKSFFLFDCTTTHLPLQLCYLGECALL